MAQKRRYVIDATPDSAVVRCNLCAWRGYSHAKSSAYRQVASHLVSAHDDRQAAYDARALAVRAVAGKLDKLDKLDSAIVRREESESQP